MCIKRNINHNVSEDAATAAIISIFAAMWQAATTGQTNSGRGRWKAKAQPAHKHLSLKTHRYPNTHTIRHWHTHHEGLGEAESSVRIAYATCSNSLQRTRLRGIRGSTVPQYHPQILATCRCYWDKEIYWLRMFFVTDFDLCAFMCSDFFHSGFI